MFPLVLVDPVDLVDLAVLYYLSDLAVLEVLADLVDLAVLYYQLDQLARLDLVVQWALVVLVVLYFL